MMNYTGRWQGFTSYYGRQIRFEMTLEATNSVFTGSLDLRDIAAFNLPLFDLKVDDQGITGSGPFGTFSGTIEDNRLLLELQGKKRVSTITLIQENPAFEKYRVPRLDENDSPVIDYQYSPPQTQQGHWEASSLKEQNIDSEKVEALISSILAGKEGQVESLLLIRGGKLVVEEYFYGVHRDYVHSIQSVTKSITSIIFGTALKEIGSLDQPVFNFFPEYSNSKWVSEKYQIDLKHLLTMSASISWNEELPYTDPNNSNTAMNNSDEWIGYVLNCEEGSEPGVISAYTSGLSILVGGVIKNVTGKYIDEVAREGLFKDLAIEEFTWSSSASGIRHTGGGLSLKSRDLAKIGQLILDKGRWQGKQVVDENWISTSTSRHLPISNESESIANGYGYQWWMVDLNLGDHSESSIAGLGYGGQYLGIFPSKDVVIVLNGGEYMYPENSKFDLSRITSTLINACD
jgi:CubicO group peptidase (beta-lactamase class C family)